MRIGLGLGIGFVRGRAVSAPFVPVSYMTFDQWSAGEAPADADTRKTRAICNIPFQTGYVIRAYRGTNPLGVLSLAQTATMPFTGGVYDWTSVGQASLGAVVYVRIARSNPDGSGLIWLSDAKSFIASDVPDAPAFTFTPTAAGASTLTFTPPVWNRRTGTGGQYQVNGGAWNNFTGTTTLNLTGLSGTTDNVGVRWVNANGNSGVTTQNVASGSAPVLTASSSVAGRVVTISASATGTPTPTVSLTTLTLDGVDVSGAAVAGTGQWTYTVPSSSNPQTVAWSVTATNAAGNATGGGSEVIAADLAAPGTVPAQTAQFGALTVAGAGGFLPLNSDGEEVALTGIVSGGGTTPPAQIVGGRLSFNGVGAPNGAAITCSHAGGNVVITIASVASAKSLATPGELATALFAQISAGSPADLMLRPGDYDVNNGGAATSGIFHNRAIPQANKATIKRHPGQAQRPRFVKPNTSSNSYWYNTSWIELNGVDFWQPNGAVQMITAGKTGGVLTRTNNITFRDVSFRGPEVPLSFLNDLTSHLEGYTGPLALGPKLLEAYNLTFEDVTFANVYSAGDFSADGTLIMRNITSYNCYADNIRIRPQLDTGNGESVPNAPKIFDGIRAYNFFGINNEMSPDGITNLAPHNDFMQVIGGTLKYAVFRNCTLARGPYRGDVVQTHQNNARINRCIYHENVGINKGSAWGFNSEGADYLLFNQCTYAGDRLSDSTYLRFGSSGLGRIAYGEMRIRNTYVGNPGGTGAITIDLTNSIDPASIVLENSFAASGTPQTNMITGPMSPVDTVAALQSFKPIIGGALDTNNIGALTTAGVRRGTELPPMCGLAPALSVSGADLIVTPSASLIYDVLPTQWQYRQRDGDYAAWGAPVTRTGASFTITGGAINQRQIMCRWGTAAGVWGTWSEPSTVTGGTDPAPKTPPTATFVAAAVSSLSNSVQYRDQTFWATGGLADTSLDHLVVSLFRQTSGAQRTMAAPDQYFINQTPAQNGVLTNIATFAAAPSGSRRQVEVGFGRPTTNERGARLVFSNSSGTFAGQTAMAAVKMGATYTVVGAAIDSGSNLATAGARSVSLNAPAGTKLVAVAYGTAGAMTCSANVTQVDATADGGDANSIIATAISTGAITPGTVTVTASNANALIVCVVAAP